MGWQEGGWIECGDPAIALEAGDDRPAILKVEGGMDEEVPEPGLGMLQGGEGEGGGGGEPALGVGGPVEPAGEGLMVGEIAEPGEDPDRVGQVFRPVRGLALEGLIAEGKGAGKEEGGVIGLEDGVLKEEAVLLKDQAGIKDPDSRFRESGGGEARREEDGQAGSFDLVKGQGIPGQQGQRIEVDTDGLGGEKGMVGTLFPEAEILEQEPALEIEDQALPISLVAWVEAGLEEGFDGLVGSGDDLLEGVEEDDPDEAGGEDGEGAIQAGDAAAAAFPADGPEGPGPVHGFIPGPGLHPWLPWTEDFREADSGSVPGADPGPL